MRISTASIASTANRSSTDPYTCGTPHSTARALARSRLESQRATTSHRACPRYPGTFRAPTLPTPIIPIRTFSKGAPQATKWLANRKRAMKLVALTSGCWRSWGRQPIRWRRLGGRFFAKPSREQASVCFIDAQLTRSPFLRVPSCLSRSKRSVQQQHGLCESPRWDSNPRPAHYECAADCPTRPCSPLTSSSVRAAVSSSVRPSPALLVRLCARFPDAATPSTIENDGGAAQT